MVSLSKTPTKVFAHSTLLLNGGAVIFKILEMVEIMDVDSNAEFGCGISPLNPFDTTTPLFIQGEIARVGTLTPRRSNLKPFLATWLSGGGTFNKFKK